MKRILIICTFIIGFCIGMTITYSPVQAEMGYSAHNIKGTYYFLGTETRNDPLGTILHCETHGTVTFFADGNAVSYASATCDGVSNTPEFGCLTYEIIGNDLSITQVSPLPDFKQCKILNRGKMLLCNGGEGINPGLLTWAGTAGRMSREVDRSLRGECSF